MTIYKNAQLIIFSTCLIFLSTISAHAADATFSWIASNEPVSGYKIYYGTSSRNYNFTVDVGLPIAVGGEIIASVEGLLEGYTYYFSATAYSLTEESDYSVEVVYTVPGTAESNNAIVNVTGDVAFELGELLVTSDWQHVDFSTEFASSPSLVAKSTTINDPETGLVTIRNLTSQGFDIRIREWDYADGLHPEETISFLAMERGHHQIADNTFAVAECTNISGLNNYEQVAFASALPSQPVVLSSIVTVNEANAAILRMKAITNQGFSITMQEQESNDGSHAEETFCFIAMEKWSGIVDDLMVEVGSTEKTLSDTGSTIFFNQQFPTIPFILADMQSTHGTDTAILGMSNISGTDITMTVLEEQSADSEVGHTTEVGGYIAVTPLRADEAQINPKLLDGTS